MWPTVPVAKIEGGWRPLSDAEKIVAQNRIEDAETELQFQLRQAGVVSPPAGDALWAKMYVNTVAEMVRRYLLNPDAWLSESEKIDDYAVDRRRDSAVSSGLLYVSDAELAKLLPAPSREKRGAFNVILGSS